MLGYHSDNDNIVLSRVLLQPREEFVSRLLSSLKQRLCTRSSDAVSSADDFDSWEAVSYTHLTLPTNREV